MIWCGRRQNRSDAVRMLIFCFEIRLQFQVMQLNRIWRNGSLLFGRGQMLRTTDSSLFTEKIIARKYVPSHNLYLILDKSYYHIQIIRLMFSRMCWVCRPRSCYEVSHDSLNMKIASTIWSFCQIARAPINWRKHDSGPPCVLWILADGVPFSGCVRVFHFSNWCAPNNCRHISSEHTATQTESACTKCQCFSVRIVCVLTSVHYRC